MAETVTFPEIPTPDEAVAQRAIQLRAALPSAAGLPAGSLGELENAVTWLASCQGHAPAQQPQNVTLVIVPGTHGISEAAPEISALPANYTQSAVGLLRSGDSPIAVACRQAGIALDLIDAPLGSPAAAIDAEDSLPADIMNDFLAAGAAKADALADAGTGLVLIGDLGRGVTTVASAMIGSICGVEPVKIIGRGSGIGDEAWRVKVRVIRDAMFRVRDDRAVGERILYRLGGADMAYTAGLLAQCAARRTPVIFDGLGVAAAALCAEMLAPGASQWWRAASQSAEPASEVALRGLMLEPLTNWGIGTGLGLGAVMAYSTVAQAVALVDDREPGA